MTCSVQECQTKIYAKGTCKQHYMMLYRYGCLERPRRTIEQRFFSKVDKQSDPNGCWNWKAGKNHGYGAFYKNGSMNLAHRFSWEIVNGPVQFGLELDHLCRNRACVNPKHLEPVTSRENTLRGVGISAQYAKRTACHRGHPFSGDNLLVTKTQRVCLQCNNEKSMERLAGRSDSVSASQP